MMHECDRVGDAIWEHARTGADLPADVSRHIGECAECARLMNDARRILSLAEQAIPVPDAPDCRAEVMARISGARATRSIWAYACASAILVMLLVGVFIALRPQARPTQVVRRAQSPVHTTPEPTANNQAPEIIRRAAPEHRVVMAKHAVPHHRRRTAPMTAPEQAIPRDEAPTSEQQIAAENRPVAAVSVTWGAEPSESSSYAYTERDEATGETTICRVVKSPGAVSIFMKSTPGGQEPPSKGA